MNDIFSEGYISINSKNVDSLTGSKGTFLGGLNSKRTSNEAQEDGDKNKNDEVEEEEKKTKEEEDEEIDEEEIKEKTEILADEKQEILENSNKLIIEKKFSVCYFFILEL